MNDTMRGMRWRLASGLVGVILVLVWMASGVNAPVLQIEWGVTPELAGAEVVVDGEVIGMLELRGRRTRTGFKVEKGTHQVLLRWTECPGVPTTVEAVGGLPAVLTADIEDRMVDGRVQCVVVLRG